MIGYSVMVVSALALKIRIKAIRWYISSINPHLYYSLQALPDSKTIYTGVE